MTHATQPPKRKRSDWRSCPRDYDTATGLSFVTYLCGAYTRGFDWTPERPPSGVMKLHESRPEGGVGPLRRFFVRWLDGKEENVPPVTHAQVSRAVERARQRDPLRFEALAWRMQPSSQDKPTAIAFCRSKNISAMTLHRWFYKAVELVVEELVAELNGQRYAEGTS